MRRTQHKHDAPGKIERDDERKLKAYIDFRKEVAEVAVTCKDTRDHLLDGYRALSQVNKDKLEALEPEKEKKKALDPAQDEQKALEPDKLE